MQKKESISDKIWGVFSSVKLAIVVFSLIALTSIVGTIIEQQANPEKNLKVLSRLVGEDLAPATYRFLDALGFMDMYRSWWFLGLLGLFAMNILVCSIDRFPAIWRLVRAPLKPLPDGAFASLPIKLELTLKGDPNAGLEKARKAMKSIGFNAQEGQDETGARQLFSQKTPWSRFGIYIAHLSIILILIGALIGIFFGFKGYMNIREGTAMPVVFLNKNFTQAEFEQRKNLLDMLQIAQGDLNTMSQGLGMSVPKLKSTLRKFGIILLDFGVKCDDFDMQFYGQSDMPKAYSSLLTILKGQTAVKSQWIQVNSPLKFEGITFYQSNFGLIDDISGGEAIFEVSSSSGNVEQRNAKIGESFTLPGSNQTVTVKEFSPALKIDEMGRPFTYNDSMTNPAVQVEIQGPSGVSRLWILKREPSSGMLPDGTVLKLVDFWGVQFTGLQARKDPGVWVVYTGCLTLALGLFLAFFMSHKKLWIRISPAKGGSRIQIAGSVSKNKFSFEKRLEKMAGILNEGGK